MSGNRVEELPRGIFLLRGEAWDSHGDLIPATYKNGLIDSALDQDFFPPQGQLPDFGLKLTNIDIIINTYERLEHIGAKDCFQEFSLIAASRPALTRAILHVKKLLQGKEEVPLRPYRPSGENGPTGGAMV